MTRDAVQGFIDGYLAIGGDPSELEDAVDNWLKDHPLYPMSEKDRSVVLGDLESYRGVEK